MNEDDPKGRAKGGLKRAEVLSPEKKSEIAQKGAAARWGVQATHKGSFKEEFGIDVDCYVLNDLQKTPVITQIGMARALGMSPRGSSLPDFLASKAMADSVGGEVAKKIDKPLKFQYSGGGGGTPTVIAHGYDATLLVDVCKAISSAETSGKLSARHANITKQAHVILGASARAGIRGLVYALAGYNPSAQEVIEAFKAYIQEEAKKYEREFPNELYAQWHRLYKIPVPERGKPWHFKNLTVKHIYYPLATSNGKLYELLKALKASDGDRQKKLFQFLNEIGARALRMQLGRVLEMCESSADRWEYEQKIKERFGGQQELNFLPIPISST